MENIFSRNSLRKVVRVRMFDLKLMYILLSVYLYTSIHVLKSQNINIVFNHVLDNVACYKHFPSTSYSECLNIFQSGKYGVNVMLYKRNFLLCSLCFSSNTPTMKKVPGIVLAYLPVKDGNTSHENLAQGKPTTQVSTYFTNTSGNASSDLAVDGIWESDMVLNPDSYLCTHTSSQPWLDEYWWMVDLEHIYQISNIVILNRGDCCWERLNNITVTVGESDQDMHVCGEFEGPGQRGEIIHITCVTPLSGQYVRISKPPPTLLALCEVAVYR